MPFVTGLIEPSPFPSVSLTFRFIAICRNQRNCHVQDPQEGSFSTSASTGYRRGLACKEFDKLTKIRAIVGQNLKGLI